MIWWYLEEVMQPQLLYVLQNRVAKGKSHSCCCTHLAGPLPIVFGQESSMERRKPLSAFLNLGRTNLALFYEPDDHTHILTDTRL
ncbi:hypothetical protein FNV43_RR10471 [Rhamnella rubrinervis]|uniref:Uncharacterized protein n=1 Tax=Rhamnella rubrinervis TaxID=2594499 RepID=A0A8K0HCF4_9ROSA|nr:hypothetical protein FNV43_RR10471 [Rhamnella rubrinervis]